MALFPVRHPQKDFFVLDLADVVPKDDTASMEHPIFSLATKPDMRFLHYQGANGDTLEIEPSGKGLPTIFDKDMMVATNRRTDGDSYELLEKAFSRLRGTNFKTTIRTGDRMEKKIFGLIEEGGFVYHDDDRFRRNYCEVVLSDWLFRAIESTEVVSITA